jgi:hypothetical protein
MADHRAERNLRTEHVEVEGGHRRAEPGCLYCEDYGELAGSEQTVDPHAATSGRVASQPSHARAQPGSMLCFKYRTTDIEVP